MKEMWDARYLNEEYAYGIKPNAFFKEAIEKYKLNGTILLPAEGEGRNAVYAAKMGMKVTAFDISEEGKKKALKLAEKENVTINYKVGDFFDLDIIKQTYKSAALIFAHLPVSILSKYHQKIADLIEPNGFIVLEGFSKNHLKLSDENPSLGGPKNIEMLFSKESIQKDFSDFEILLLQEINVNLSEGKYHNGVSSVIRFIGKKKEA